MDEDLRLLVRTRAQFRCEYCHLPEADSPVFNPRRHKWERHFVWDHFSLVGKTTVGRTTIEVLRMNNDDRIQLRQTLHEIGRFPW